MTPWTPHTDRKNAWMRSAKCGVLFTMYADVWTGKSKKKPYAEWHVVDDQGVTLAHGVVESPYVQRNAIQAKRACTQALSREYTKMVWRRI